MKLLIFGGMLCVLFSITTTLAMEKEEQSALFEIVIDKQEDVVALPLKQRDRIRLKKIEEPQQELPPMSWGGKIVSSIFAGGVCVGTSVAAALGEWGTIILVSDQIDHSDEATPIMAGTTVGLGICALGLCTYGCGVAATKWYRTRQAKNSYRQILHEIAEKGSV